MVKLGCGIDGVLNEAKFSKSLPWIGVYIAAASLTCAVAMAADVIHGFRHWKLWFPCKFFTINLTKLSSTALICTVVGNSMPSRNYGEQRNTYQYYNFGYTCDYRCGTYPREPVTSDLNSSGIGGILRNEESKIMGSFSASTGPGPPILAEVKAIQAGLALFVKSECFSALTVPTIKHYLELKYKKKYEMAQKECSVANETNNSLEDKLREALMRYWMMTYTCSPQFVIGRSVTCTASGALCLSKKKGNNTIWYKLEEYWIRTLVEMKECPLNIPAGIVFISKVIRLISVYFMGGILLCYDRCRDQLMKFTPDNSIGNDSGLELPHITKLDLSHFVLHLEGEDSLVEVVMKDNRDATDYWRRKAKKKQPKYFMELLELSRPCEGFKGLTEFDIPNIESCSIKRLIAGVNEEKNIFMEFKKCNANLCLLDDPSKWPIKVLAANSMYRICQSILLDYEAKDYRITERLFEAITVMVSDTLAACLTNLKQFITIKCSTTTIEEREKSV
ncbi:hypothetical protein F3Y22_tig00111166pilonHSYRG00022 [Hibiscus syriacus]|uniref:Uncharacterized protein n=1 Tax=Hibiscus syriacus TaxID=106335 RepID=A0A6A2YW92_HIBSY|nr:hypothetical protein F3Y22_tig00111166pilonHSYRG00022 [Hibiscus syriacus]